MNEHLDIQLIAIVTAVACALPGVFLVLRRMTLMSDAISHAILPGIVLAFFLTESLSSPLLILAAAGTGVLTVLLVELLQRTKLVKEDAAIGLTFPALFSIGVILISRFAGNVHLDMDVVLLGELAYAPLNRLKAFGYDLGPIALYVMGTILVLNTVFIFVFYKELKLATFDASLAAALGFAPTLIHYGLMTLVSVTTVGAFDAVGSILVVALIAGPPTTAYLMTDKLSLMLILSAIIGSVNAVSGYWLASLFDVSIAGAIATMTLIVFGLIFLTVPNRGLIAIARRDARQKWEFAQTMLVIHLFNHEGLPEAEAESAIADLHEHLSWDPTFTNQVVRYALNNRCVSQDERQLTLTEQGRAIAQQALVQ
ncbi:zinc ABC transporter permease [Candidatus Poribacteria bacterium]|nr:MAG: zinc ABC transporter permease [Candidatus Poribacteria bacterium]